MSEAESQPATDSQSNPVLPEVVNTAPAPAMIPPPPGPAPVVPEKPVEPSKTVIEVKLEPPRRNVVEYAVVGLIALILGFMSTAILVNYTTSVVRLGGAKTQLSKSEEEKTELSKRLEVAVSGLKVLKAEYESSLDELEQNREKVRELVTETEEAKVEVIELGHKYSELQEVLVKIKQGEIKVKIDKDFDPTSTNEIVKEANPEEKPEEKPEEEVDEKKKSGKVLFKPWTWLRKKK